MLSTENWVPVDDQMKSGSFEDEVYEFVPASEREKLLNEAPRDDEEVVDTSDEEDDEAESSLAGDDSSFSRRLPPPMPLFSVAELGISNQTARIFTGASIRHVDHIPADPSELRGAPLGDPLLSRMLGKWFTRRARLELSRREALVESGSIVVPPALTSSNDENGDEEGTPPLPNVHHVEMYRNDMYEEAHCGSTPSFSDGVTVDVPVSFALTFDSAFESGNMDRVYRVFNRDVCLDEPISKSSSNSSTRPANVHAEYDLVCRNDINTSGHIQWYYFSAQAPQGAEYPLRVRFNLTNMMKRDALYNFGMKPAVYSETRAATDLVGWRHEGEDVAYYKNWLMYTKGKKKKLRSHYSLSFTYTFTGPDTVYFAHCFPYTYTTLQRYLHAKSIDPRVSKFLRRRVLAKTLAGNTCDLVVIAADSNELGVAKNRPAVVISARIHPGESNSSFMMQGVIDYLTSDTDEAKLLRERFIFKIVPMLNPDGVVHGNYRCSLAGSDLNRRYGDTHMNLHPTVYALKNMLSNAQSSRGVLLYLDLHGHSRNKNGFFYGCDVSLQSEKYLAETLNNTSQAQFNCRRIYSRIFPEILARVSNSSEGGYFSYRDSAFRVQASKSGTGRVVSWRHLKIDGSYTIELSFCGNGDNREGSIFKRILAQQEHNDVGDSGGSHTAAIAPPSTAIVTKSSSVRHTSSRDAFEEDDKGVLGDDENDVKVLADDTIASRSCNGSLTQNTKSSSSSSSWAVSSCIGSEDAEYRKLRDSYQKLRHWCFNDYLRMGHHLGAAVFKFANLDGVLSEQSGKEKCISRSSSRDGEDSMASGSGGGSNTFSETESDKELGTVAASRDASRSKGQRVKVIHSFDPTEPVIESAVYGAKAIEAVVGMFSGCHEKIPSSDKADEHHNAPPQIEPSLRLLTEMSVRKSLDLTSGVDVARTLRANRRNFSLIPNRLADDLNNSANGNYVDDVDELEDADNSFELLAPPDENMNEDMGSDSDPSGDNLPVEEVMKLKSFGSLTKHAQPTKTRSKRKVPKRKKFAAAAREVMSALKNGVDVSASPVSNTKAPVATSTTTSFGRSVSATDLASSSKGYVVHKSSSKSGGDSVKIDQLVKRANPRARRLQQSHSLPRFVQSYKLDDDSQQFSVTVKNMSLGHLPGADLGSRKPHSSHGGPAASPAKSPIKESTHTRGAGNGHTKTIWTSAAAGRRMATTELSTALPKQSNSGQGIIAGLKLHRGNHQHKSTGSLNTTRKPLPMTQMPGEQINMANMIMSMIREDTNHGKPVVPVPGQHGIGGGDLYAPLAFSDTLMSETLSQSSSSPAIGGFGGVCVPMPGETTSLADADWGARPSNSHGRSAGNNPVPPYYQESPNSLRKSILRKRHSQGGPAVSISGRNTLGNQSSSGGSNTTGVLGSRGRNPMDFSSQGLFDE